MTNAQRQAEFNPHAVHAAMMTERTIPLTPDEQADKDVLFELTEGNIPARLTLLGTWWLRRVERLRIEV